MNIEIPPTDKDPQFEEQTEKYLQSMEKMIALKRAPNPEIQKIGEDEITQGKRPINALIRFLEPNLEVKSIVQELKKYIQNQAPKETPKKVITPEITLPPIKQETIHSEKEIINLPEVTLTLPTGEFVVKRGDEITKESNAALYKRITSKLAQKLQGDVEKYEIKSTFVGKKDDVVVRITPTYTGGIVGEPIGITQKWLESDPKSRQKAAEKIEADHVQIDGVTINVGDALPKNIADMVNAGQKDGQPQSDTWTIDRVFYHTYPITKEDGSKGVDGGMRMGLTAPDGTKTSVSLGELRMTLQQKKDAVMRAQRAEKKAAQAAEAAKAAATPATSQNPAEKAPAAQPNKEKIVIPTSVTIQGITFSKGDTMSPEQVAACDLATTAENSEPLTWILETFKKAVKNPQNIVAKFTNNLGEEKFIPVWKIEKNLGVTTDEANAESSPTAEAPASAEKIVQRPMTEAERLHTLTALYEQYPFLKPTQSETAQTTPSQEATPPATDTETIDSKTSPLKPAVKKSLEEIQELGFMSIKGLGLKDNWFDKPNTDITEKDNPKIYQVIHKTMMAKKVVPVLGGSIYTVQRMYKQNHPDGTSTRFIEIKNQKGQSATISQDELQAIAWELNDDEDASKVETQAPTDSVETTPVPESSAAEAPTDDLEQTQESIEEATSTSQENNPESLPTPSELTSQDETVILESTPERTPLKELTTGNMRDAIKSIFATFDKTNKKITTSDIGVHSNGQGGILIKLTQKINNGFLSASSALDTSFELTTQDGKIILDNINLDSKDDKITNDIETYQNNILGALDNLQNTLSVANDLPVETTEFAVENSTLVAYQK